MLGSEIELLHDKLKTDARDRRRLLKAQVEAEKALKEQRMTIGDLKCSWCDKWITDEWDHFYQCIHHGDIFCDYCAKNYYKAEIPFIDAPKCKKKFFDMEFVDCIYHKKPNVLIEIENVDK